MEKDSWVYEGNRDPQKKKKPEGQEVIFVSLESINAREGNGILQLRSIVCTIMNQINWLEIRRRFLVIKTKRFSNCIPMELTRDHNTVKKGT